MKVLIVGAGIAGPTLGYWLLEAGHEVALVERSPELRRGGYLVDFWGAGFDVAERMGIVPELRRRGYVMTEARAVDRDGRRVASIDPSAIMGSLERYVSIARSDLAAVIFDALGGKAELILDDTVEICPTTAIGSGSRSLVGRSATSTWWWGRTGFILGCGGWCSAPRRCSSGIWGWWLRRSRSTATVHGTSWSP